MSRSYTFIHEDRPWTLNAERGMHWARHGALTAEWRQAFWAIALENKRPRMQRVDIEVTQTTKTKRMPDPVACFGAFKAALDGLVDAGVISNDTGKFVRSVCFAPIRVTGKDSLEIKLTEVEE